MKSLLLVLLGLIIGGVAGLIGGGLYGTGVGAGVGVATGLKSGACLTVEAAKAEGLITAEQVDQVLNAAIRQIASQDLAPEDALTGTDAECQKVIERLKTAAASAG